jgi:hypothetical protein
MTFRKVLVVAALLSGAAFPALSQFSLPIYTDQLVNGFQDWSWAPHNLSSTTTVHSGADAISVSATNWQGISFHHADFDSSGYSSFAFWAHGGTTGGQLLRVYAELSGVGQANYDFASPLAANTWQQFVIPLTALGVANQPNLSRLNIQLRAGGTTNTYYLDDIQLLPNSAIHVSVDCTQAVRVVDTRHFGVNLAIWDSYYDPPYNTTTTALLKEMGCTVVRLPGGSLSDEYHWASNTSLTNTWQWQASFADMVRVMTNAGVQAFITVNYGTGTPQEAAGWVRHANVTNHLGYKYWEIGNECYGTWETDTNSNAHDAFTYATRATNYVAQMRAADPTIKIGVVAVPGETSSSNGYTNHPAINPRTGQTNFGWTPVLLTTLKNAGVTPDFLIHHVYPEWTDPNNPANSPDNDTNLLQYASNWASDAANLRQQITDYFGPSGTNIELVCTENNSDSGAQGKQSTSLVNGLYYADSLGQLLKTEFNGFVWWDLRNGTDTGGYFGSNLYGWRTYGDLGMINGLTTRHPTFYAAKMMQYFARPGDQILNATTDAALVTPYAARRVNGSVSLLLLNKYPGSNLNAEVTLNGFVPNSAATVRLFGIPNDEAARTNGPAASMDITTNSVTGIGSTFTNNCLPYSMTLLTLSPAPPSLAVLPSLPGQFVLQLQGQAGVPYVLQSSSNMATWLSISTNTLAGNSVNFTNAITPPAPKFWRALWQP